MQGNYFLCKPEFKQEHLDQYVKERVGQLLLEGKVAAVKVEEYHSPMTMRAKALYFVWIKQIVEHFKRKNWLFSVLDDDGNVQEKLPFDKDTMHVCMKRILLGTKTIKCGNMEVQKDYSIKNFDTSDGYNYMRKLEEFALDKWGIVLEVNPNSTYQKFLDDQNK